MSCTSSLNSTHSKQFEYKTCHTQQMLHESVKLARFSDDLYLFSVVNSLHLSCLPINGNCGGSLYKKPAAFLWERGKCTTTTTTGASSSDVSRVETESRLRCTFTRLTLFPHAYRARWLLSVLATHFEQDDCESKLKHFSSSIAHVSCASNNSSENERHAADSARKL